MPHQITRICEYCGKSFTLICLGLTVPKGRGRFCDRLCGNRANKSRPEAERFWEKVNKNGPVPERRPDLGPCWLWTGSTQKGYGKFTSSVNGAHVWAYLSLVGSIPQGYELDHLCFVRPCVNPSHLEPVTKRENILRGESISAKYARRTHCKLGHPFAGENLLINKQGRGCRTCRRQYQQAAGPRKNEHRRQRRRGARMGRA